MAISGYSAGQAGRIIDRMIRPGSIAAGFGGGVDGVAPVKIDQIDLAKQIGIEFKRIQGGGFIYQGKKDIVNSFGIAETPFTIGQMKKLLEIKGDEARAVFNQPGWDIDVIIKRSEKTAAKEVTGDEIDNCPLVYISNVEASEIAKLFGKRLLSEKEWERAASGTTGLKRPWGDELDKRYAVYADNGTRPVKSRPAGASAKGVYDLIGNVWEWLQGAVLRGGSWVSYYPDSLQAAYRCNYRLGLRNFNIGFRLAED